jgi:hypothetical protein
LIRRKISSNKDLNLGASDGRIHCWNAETGSRVCTLVSDSMSGQTIVSMNPKFMLLVSASNQLVSLVKEFFMKHFFFCIDFLVASS